MFSGVFNIDSLTQTFRDISQRRRQGALEISLVDDSRQEVHFISGRIVDVVRVGVAPALDLLERLIERHLVSESWRGRGVATYESLFDALSNEFPEFDRDYFQLTLHHMVLDKLYTLIYQNGAYFTFNVKMIEIEKDFAPSISVGQLLLDVVALQSETERFNQIFNQDQMIKLVDLDLETLSCEERLIAEVLVDSACSISELRSRTILSSYHFAEAILSLYDHNLIQFGNFEQKGSGSFAELDELAQFMDDKIDAQFADSEEPISSQESFQVEHHITEQPDNSPRVEQREESSIERLSLRARFNLWNVHLLQMSWIPNLIALLVLGFAVVAPLVFWSRMVTEL